MTDDRTRIEEIGKAIGLIGTKRPSHTPAAISGPALPYAELSFSSDGEDVHVRRHFKKRGVGQGLYVDIGCGYPHLISNTYALYCLGWRGLCVDPNPDFSGPWAYHRSRDRFLNVAVGDATGQTTFFRHQKNVGMSLIGPTQPSSRDYDPGIAIPMERLDVIFTQHIQDQPIHFMNIDVEGVELAALQSNDWGRWRPQMILMECHDFDALNPLAKQPVSYLVGLGYRISGLFGANVMLLAD